MPMTLAESAKYSQEKLYPKVIEEILKVSYLLKRVPFIELNGTSLRVTYEDVANPSTMAFYGANEQIVESTGQLLQKDFSLTRLMGDAQVDNMLRKSRSNPIDIMAEQLRLKSKALAHAFETCVVYGGTGNEFNGLHASTIMASGQIIKEATDATPLVLEAPHLDELVDKVAISGKPDVLLMNRQMLRTLTQYLRGKSMYQDSRDEYGDYWVVWNGVPIAVTDFITSTELCDGSGDFSAKTGGVGTSIFALRFGAGDGLCGIQSGNIVTEQFGRLEDYDGTKVRMKWYCGMALYASTAVAVIQNINPALAIS